MRGGKGGDDFGITGRAEYRRTAKEGGKREGTIETFVQEEEDTTTDDEEREKGGGNSHRKGKKGRLGKQGGSRYSDSSQLEQKDLPRKTRPTGRARFSTERTSLMGEKVTQTRNSGNLAREMLKTDEGNTTIRHRKKTAGRARTSRTRRDGFDVRGR